MAGATIDHIVSLTVFLAALLVFIGFYNQTIQTAILYQQHKYLATKCSDLLDNMLLNPGSPSNDTLYWGTSNCTVTGFGLQDPESTTYRLDPFSLMRLLHSDQVFYAGTGKWYSNVSWGQDGGYLLMPQNDCVNYSTVTKLLGINGTFGMYLEISPTLVVTVDEANANPLTLSIQVSGKSSPLGNASLSYLMFWTNSTSPENVPSINFNNGTLQTDSSGTATKVFSDLSIDNNATAYTFIVKASISGISGIGYKSRNLYIQNTGNVVPIVDSFKDGIILLAHNFEKDPGDSNGALHFNATFYSLPDNFLPTSRISNITGIVNSGGGQPFQTLQIPSEARSTPGFLLVAYRKGNDLGLTVMPWGIGSIGFSATTGVNPSSSAQEWVAADIRQVIVCDTTYQAKLLLWSLQGYQVAK
jgi:hypothetical protein